VLVPVYRGEIKYIERVVYYPAETATENFKSKYILDVNSRGIVGKDLLGFLEKLYPFCFIGFLEDVAGKAIVMVIFII
jgi:hypothetical protein